MRRRKGYRALGRFVAMRRTVALGAALAIGGCAAINTPLPPPRPTASTTMSAKDQKKAVDEMNQKRETHEQDAEMQIEQSR